MMKKTTRSVFFLLVIAFALNACSSSRQALYLDIPQTNVEFKPELLDLLADATSPAHYIQTIDGQADIWIKTPKMKKSMFCNIKVKRGEAIQIRGSVMFGITVLDALIRADSIFIYNVFGGEVLVGKNNPHNFNRFLMGLPFDFTQLTDAFLGLPSFSIDPTQIERITSEKSKIGYYLKGTRQRAIMVDSTKTTVESIQIYDGNGRKQAMANYREFELVPVGARDVILPNVIEFVSLSNPVSNASNRSKELIIVYSDRELNHPDFKFDFEIPKGAKVIKLENRSLGFSNP